MAGPPHGTGQEGVVTAYLPELLTPWGAYELTEDEAYVMVAAMGAMRNRREARTSAGWLTEVGDKRAAALVDMGLDEDSVAEVMGVSAGRVRGAVRRVECGRYA